MSIVLIEGRKMKRLIAGKKSHKHKDHTQTNGRLHENGNIHCADEDIQSDDASETRPLPFRDKGFGNNGSSPNRATDLSMYLHTQATVPTKTTEVSLRRDLLHRNIPANRDSGISLTSNISSTEPLNLISDLHTKYESCTKHPKHDRFIAIFDLDVRHMPENFRTPSWVKLLKLKGVDVVRLAVSRTSDDRPDVLGFRGIKAVRFGTGTAFVHKMDNTEVCDCDEGAPGHRCSGVFLVMTASHVVFDDSEARETAVEFFYDSMDTSTVVRAWGERVVSVDVDRNRSIIECRTHDIGLWQRLKDAQRERDELIQKELELEVGSHQIAVLISHPHGLCKQVSFGHLKNTKLVGEVKNKDGVQLADCLITYDTPTCPGSGGGPVNVLGGGHVSFAFAPHCASMATGENMSGLGWVRVG